MSTSRDRRLAVIYAFAIFVSAFLLFQIQPLISKRILPWFGGSPAVWTTCLLFFQTVLFVGYAYAHWSNTYLKPRRQALVQAALIVLALILLHVPASENLQPTGADRPISRILLILTLSVGLPYFALSATGPLLQAWFARTFPGRIPYRLYAVSNTGSLLALASYPFFFEPTFSLRRQSQLWTIGFVIYAGLYAYIAWRMSLATRSGQSPKLAPESKSRSDLASMARPPGWHYALWLILSAFASVVLIATTNHISTDIAVMPLLWIVPLALYLITFIIAFDRPAWYHRLPVALIAVVAIYATAATHHFGMGFSSFYEFGTVGLIVSCFGDPNELPPMVRFATAHFLIANFSALFAICLLCHGEIVRTRPAPQYLTSFYLMISAGGALGGVFATIVAPLLFTTYLEWNATLWIACLAALAIVTWTCVASSFKTRENGAPTKPSSCPPGDRIGKARQLNFQLRSRSLLGIAMLVLLPVSLVILIDVNELLGTDIKNVRWSARNFFGALAIREKDSDDENWSRYDLFHGTTTHGSQFKNSLRRREPTTYFSQQSGVGHAIAYFQKHLPPDGMRLGVVGLGAGTLAAYPNAGDSITFYEINPTIIQLAEEGEWFTYVRDCRARGANCDIRLGDARLTLQHELERFSSPSSAGEGGEVASSPNYLPYHILVLDAFSGDSVPVHLLTVEAFKLYLASLATASEVNGKPTESGAIAVHISNRFLNLEPVIRAVALHFNLLPLAFFSKDDPAHDIRGARWIILTRNTALAAELGKLATQVEVYGDPVLWTDDRSSLVEILR